MVTELNGTLYSAIEDHAHFKQVVLEAVSIELKKLGTDIYALEWASVAAYSWSGLPARAA